MHPDARSAIPVPTRAASSGRYYVHRSSAIPVPNDRFLSQTQPLQVHRQRSTVPVPRCSAASGWSEVHPDARSAIPVPTHTASSGRFAVHSDGAAAATVAASRSTLWDRIQGYKHRPAAQMPQRHDLRSSRKHSQKVANEYLAGFTEKDEDSYLLACYNVFGTGELCHIDKQAQTCLKRIHLHLSRQQRWTTLTSREKEQIFFTAAERVLQEVQWKKDQVAKWGAAVERAPALNTRIGLTPFSPDDYAHMQGATGTSPEPQTPLASSSEVVSTRLAKLRKRLLWHTSLKELESQQALLKGSLATADGARKLREPSTSWSKTFGTIQAAFKNWTKRKKVKKYKQLNIEIEDATTTV